MELAFWQSVEGSDDPKEYQAYLAQFPEGAFVALAEARLKGASNSSRSADHTVELEFWNSIKDTDVRENFEAYLEKYPDGEFRSLAEMKLKRRPARPARIGNSGVLKARRALQRFDRAELVEGEPYLAQIVIPPVAGVHRAF